MQALSALTPPLLVCAVVIIAIVAFLRHEMRRSRADSPAPEDEGDTPAVPRLADTDKKHAGLTDVAQATADDRASPHRDS